MSLYSTTSTFKRVVLVHRVPCTSTGTGQRRTIRQKRNSMWRLKPNLATRDFIATQPNKSASSSSAFSSSSYCATQTNQQTTGSTIHHCPIPVLPLTSYLETKAQSRVIGSVFLTQQNPSRLGVLDLINYSSSVRNSGELNLSWLNAAIPAKSPIVEQGTGTRTRVFYATTGRVMGCGKRRQSVRI